MATPRTPKRKRGETGKNRQKSDKRKAGPAPERMRDAIMDAQKKTMAEKRVILPKYEYPDHVITAARCNFYSCHHVDFAVARDEAVRITELDAMRAVGKSIFENGYLLSEKAAAEKAAAEKWQLSDREWEIVKSIGKKGTET